MSSPAGSQQRGTERLLRDCALVGRMLETPRAPARQRLERELGHKLTRRLVHGLRRRPQLDNGV